MISVVIPTCDRPAYLQQAIASVLAQSLQPDEIFVVDNGRHPVHPEAQSPRITRLRLPPRCGVSRARNHGAWAARGKYLAFLDDDDWWEPDFLAASLAVMQQRGVRCVYGCKSIWINGDIKPYKLPAEETLTISNLLRRNPGTGGQNLVVERELFLELKGFDESLPALEDRDFALRVRWHGDDIGVAEKAIAVLRCHRDERLRQDPRNKIPFIWKYRHHLTVREWAITIGKLYLMGVVHKLFRTGKRQTGKISHAKASEHEKRPPPQS